MIGCRQWFVGGTKDEHFPHDGATGDAFILVNAMVALSTNLASMGTLIALPIWGVAAVVGGVVSTELGARRLKRCTMRFILAAILALSGLKLIVP
jgi:uncharacterized protein